jgi:predicted RND superfamily exporter protein
MSALPSTSSTPVHVDDARPTLLGVGLVVVPAVIVLVLASLFLHAWSLLLPILVAVLAVLGVLGVAMFLRGPTVTRD